MRGWSQQQLAGAAKLSLPTITRIEADNPTVTEERVERAARALGLSFDFKTGAVRPPPDLPAEAFADATQPVEKLSKSEALDQLAQWLFDGVLDYSDAKRVIDLHRPRMATAAKPLKSGGKKSGK